MHGISVEKVKDYSNIKNNKKNRKLDSFLKSHENVPKRSQSTLYRRKRIIGFFYLRGELLLDGTLDIKINFYFRTINSHEKHRK